MKTRSLYLMAAAGGLALFAVAAPQPTSGQTPLPPQGALQEAQPAALPRPPAVRQDPLDISPQLQALIKEVTAQSKQMTANQAQIDTKLDQLTETIRQARLFAARLGKGTTK